MRVRGDQAGQATVELVALLPLVAALAAVLWQAVLAGQAFWLAGSAAQSAARAQAVSGAARDGAKEALPPGLERGLKVSVDEGDVTVAVRIPSLLGIELGAARATAHMEAQG